jgi:hypothetical protein
MRGRPSLINPKCKILSVHVSIDGKTHHFDVEDYQSRTINTIFRVMEETNMAVMQAGHSSRLRSIDPQLLGRISSAAARASESVVAKGRT